MSFARLLVLAALALTCSVAPREASAFQFGVCVHLALNRSNAATVLKLVDDAGFNSIRDDVYWSAVESTQGVLQFPAKFEQVRLAMQGAAARGGSPLLILAYGNRFYDGGGLVTSNEGISAFSRYSRFIAETFTGSVRQYEVWNEWNTGFGSKPAVTHGDASAYVQLLARASAAIRQGNPEARVVGAATSGVDFRWIRELIEAGGLAHLDALSVHSYTLFRARKNPESAIRSLDSLHELLVKAEPTRTIPIYVTEMGWPTNTGTHGVSEREAANYLVRFMLLARSRAWLGGVWWYDLIDDGDNARLADHRFGLVRRDLSPKPAFTAARAISRMVLADGEVRSHRLQSGGYVVTGTDAQGAWAVGWTLQPDLLAWLDGSTNEPAASSDLETLSAQLPAGGIPVLFRKSGGVWKADTAWHDAVVRRASPPSDVRVEERRL